MAFALVKKPAIFDGLSLGGKRRESLATIASLGHLDPAGCGYSHTAPRQPAIAAPPKEKPRRTALQARDSGFPAVRRHHSSIWRASLVAYLSRPAVLDHVDAHSLHWPQW